MSNLYATPPRVDEDAVETELQNLEHQFSLFWMQARAVANQLSRKVHPDMESAAYGLLKVIRSVGSIRLTELATNIGVGKPSVSRQVAFLEDIGLLSKEADPLDRRAQSIRLTPKGEERMRQVQDARRRVFRDRLGEWPVHELRELARYMGRLNSMYERGGFSKDGPAARDDEDS
ncbi:MarR family winged helix-turn-helix transcriptional regulator [Paenarthrobacter aromaticivorans]|uniref:MarR family transcriptional regulator n=1 Tax=Paenarthrobacter aromaticivorans TaxID=2849150 RepID=A0ABS6IDL6_9MICC|nr:MarR family transcriptional regulator [Paenarthrobacter sp. MMS21-TAE1-1]MBU8868507.1 MarR family transcriptional regulator [Paenarthrobacter sp. MMS21-TAE1-1]